jgi:tRNA pseudouridine55 synthase
VSLELDGFLNMLKPPGMSSHDLVAWVRRKFNVKTGHTGTLDPAAAGVLVLAVGKATKLASFVSDSHKSYRGELTLGESTDTGDADGKITAVKAVPVLDKDLIEEVFLKFTGTVEQKPPMHSALHHQGKRLYQLARQGIEVERPSRSISIHGLRLVHYEGKRILFDVDCSKGTYVRVLCADLAESLGSVGYMSFLLRRAIGPFFIENTSILEDLKDLDPAGMSARLLPLDYPLGHLPSLNVTAEEGKRVAHGNDLEVNPRGGLSHNELVRLYCNGQMIALGTLKQEKDKLLVKPGTVLL